MPSAAVPPKYSRRPVTNDDKDTCFSIARECYTEVVTRQFGYWDDAWQRKEFDKKWNLNVFEIIELDRRPIGVLWTEWRQDYLYIAEVQILPEYQGLGIGRAIITEEQSRAAERGADVRLQVLKMNRAKQLYERLGFRVYGQTQTHFLMIWNAVAAKGGRNA